MFPGRRGAGRIFHNEVHLSGMVPQVCLLFGPSAAGGAYIPAFCDVVVMVEGNASMYLGSPRMAEMVIGEKVTLEELGGARMHCSVSGCGDFLVADRGGGDRARAPLALVPARRTTAACRRPRRRAGRAPAGAPIEEIVPRDQNKPFDVMELVEAIVDEGSFLEVKKLWARRARHRARAHRRAGGRASSRTSRR